MYLQGVHYWISQHGISSSLVCLGVGNVPHELISNMVKICLHFMVKYYYDIMIF